LASGSADGAISIWSLDSHARLWSCQSAHGRAVGGLAASADDLTLVSVGWDGLIKVWSGRSRQEISCIRQKNRPLNAVAFHPEKDAVVVAGWDNVLKIYDLTTLERKAVLRGHQASVQEVKISADGRRVFSCDMNGHVLVFDSSTGDEVASFDAGAAVLDMTLDERSSDDVKVVLGLRDGSVQTWKLHSGDDPMSRLNTKTVDGPTASGDGGEDFHAFDRITSVRDLYAFGGYHGFTPLAVGYQSGWMKIFSNTTSKDNNPNGFIGNCLAAGKISDASLDKIVPLGYDKGTFEEDLAAVPSLFDLDWSEEVEMGEQKLEEADKAAAHCMMVITSDGEAFYVRFSPNEHLLEVTGQVKGVNGETRMGVAATATFFNGCRRALTPHGVDLGTFPGSNKHGLILGLGHGDVLSMDENPKKHMVLVCGRSGDLWLGRASPDQGLNRLYTYDNFEDFQPTSAVFLRVGDNDYCVAASSATAALHFFKVKTPKAPKIPRGGDNDEDDDEDEEEEPMDVEGGGDVDVKLLHKFTRESARGPISSLMASFSGKHFFCLHVGGGLTVWSSKGLELRSIPLPMGGSAEVLPSIGSVMLVVTDGESGLLVYDAFRSVRVSSLHGHRGAVTSVGLARTAGEGGQDGATLYSAGQDGSLKLSNLDRIPKLPSTPGFSNGIAAMTRVCNSPLLLIVDNTGLIILWNIVTSRASSHGILKLPFNLEEKEHFQAVGAAWKEEDKTVVIASQISPRRTLYVTVMTWDGPGEMRIIHQTDLPFLVLTCEVLIVESGCFEVVMGACVNGDLTYQTIVTYLSAKGHPHKRTLFKRHDELNGGKELWGVASHAAGRVATMLARTCQFPMKEARNIWVSSMASLDNMDNILVIGDTSGGLTVWDHNNDCLGFRKRAHQGEIVAVYGQKRNTMNSEDDNCVFWSVATASADGVVKLWSFEKDDGEGAVYISQQGEISLGSGAALTTMVGLPPCSGSRHLRLVVGDAAGGVHVLTGMDVTEEA
jgi:WD40 repeat protein